MPTAHPDDWAAIRAFLPEIDDGSDAACIGFLERAGYTLHRDWTWSKPGVSQWSDATEQERMCIAFLCDEWDFGGLQKQEARDGE
jgi:hypothetical protein